MQCGLSPPPWVPCLYSVWTSPIAGRGEPDRSQHGPLEPVAGIGGHLRRGPVFRFDSIWHLIEYFNVTCLNRLWLDFFSSLQIFKMSLQDTGESAGSVDHPSKKHKKRVANCFGQFMKCEALKLKNVNPVGKLNIEKITAEWKNLNEDWGWSCGWR